MLLGAVIEVRYVTARGIEPCTGCAKPRRPIRIASTTQRDYGAVPVRMCKNKTARPEGLIIGMCNDYQNTTYLRLLQAPVNLGGHSPQL